MYLLFKHATTAMALVQFDGQLVRANASLCLVTGNTPDDLCTRTLFALTPEKAWPTNPADIVSDTGNTHAYRRIQTQLIVADHARKTVLAEVVPAPDEPDQCIVLFHEIADSPATETLQMDDKRELEYFRQQKHLLADVTQALNTPDDFVDGLKNALLTLQSALDIQYASLCRYDSDSLAYNPVDLDRLQRGITGTTGCTTSTTCRFAKYYNVEEMSGAVRVLTEQHLEPEDWRVLQQTHKEGVLLMPILVGNTLETLLVFTFGAVQHPLAADVTALTLIAQIIGNAWGREKHFLAQLDAEEKQTQAVQITERSQRLAALGTLVAGIAHEINQPLTALMVAADGLLYWASRGKNLSEPDCLQDIQLISDQGNRIASIIKHMRSLLRDDVSGEPEPVSLNHCLERALSLV